jgi:signal transduction histidine kinase
MVLAEKRRRSWQVRVHVTSLVTNGQTYRDPVAVDLPAGSRELQINFSALSLAKAQKAQVRYRLEGFDLDWIDPRLRRQAFYTNLTPGSYRFQVVAANSDGVWNHEGAALAFTLPPTFLQSVWFKLLVALAIVVLATLAYRFRMRQVTARMQAQFTVRTAERERIARELHDTLLQGGQGLMLLLQAVANRTASAEVRETLDNALERVDAVLVEGRARVRDLRSGSETGELAQRLLGLAGTLIDGETPSFDLTIERKQRPLHPLVLDETSRIAEEAIRNVVAHACATRVDVVVTYGHREFALRVRDDGAGIPEAVLAAGSRTGHFGLVGMHERAVQAGGSLHISSTKAGTEIRLTVPARAAYTNRRTGLLGWFRRRPVRTT